MTKLVVNGVEGFVETSLLKCSVSAPRLLVKTLLLLRLVNCEMSTICTLCVETYLHDLLLVHMLRVEVWR